MNTAQHRFKSGFGQCECLWCGRRRSLDDCKVTADMRTALKAWHFVYGWLWKAKLNHAWQTGDYGIIAERHVQPLQLLRNTIGPRGLAKITTRLVEDYTPPKTEVQP